MYRSILNATFFSFAYVLFRLNQFIARLYCGSLFLILFLLLFSMVHETLKYFYFYFIFYLARKDELSERKECKVINLSNFYDCFTSCS